MISIGDIHHLRLTVTDVDRSRKFYTELLGFDVAVESPPPDDPAAEAMYPVLWGGVVMARGNLLMGLRPVAPGGDRFDEDRVGLDHLSFNVAGRSSTRRCASSTSGGSRTVRSVPCLALASACCPSATPTTSRSS